MAIGIRTTKIEAGQGGRLGHSNMAHYDYTEHIKAACRKARRLQGKAIIRREFKEWLGATGMDNGQKAGDITGSIRNIRSLNITCNA